MFLKNIKCEQAPSKIRIDAPKNWKLLMFDLDETLIHCFDSETSHNISIMTEEGDVLKANVNVRPFARECIMQLSIRYHIGIFTSSQ